MRKLIVILPFFSIKFIPNYLYCLLIYILNNNPLILLLFVIFINKTELLILTNYLKINNYNYYKFNIINKMHYLLLILAQAIAI